MFYDSGSRLEAACQRPNDPGQMDRPIWIWNRGVNAGDFKRGK